MEWAKDQTGETNKPTKISTTWVITETVKGCWCRTAMHRQLPSPKYKKQNSKRLAHRQRTLKVRTIKQELVLACIETYTEVMQKPIQASSLAQHKFPRKILNAVLNKDTWELMEMQQLLRNPKYFVLWGKSYTKELDALPKAYHVQKGQTPSCSSSMMKYHSTKDKMSHTEKRWSRIDQKRTTQIEQGSQ